MLVMNVIEPAQARWEALIMFNLGKYSQYWIFIDYHKFKSVDLQDSNQIPRMNKCIDWFREVEIFSRMNTNGGYWHRELSHRDEDEVALMSQWSFYWSCELSSDYETHLRRSMYHGFHSVTRELAVTASIARQYRHIRLGPEPVHCTPQICTLST